MKTQRQSAVNGEPIRRPARPTVQVDDGLYRYVPVPPVSRDEDGYLIGDSMGQIDEHLRQTTFWYNALSRWLPTATVGSDMAMHYQRGDRGATIGPDLFVALKAPRRKGRRNYRLWENPLPELVIEMISESPQRGCARGVPLARNGNSKEDVGRKLYTYQYLGVREYWLFDPEGFELPKPLAGHELREGRYEPIAADATGRLHSVVLGLDLHVRDGELRFRDPGDGRRPEDIRRGRRQSRRRRAPGGRREGQSGRRGARVGASSVAAGRFVAGAPSTS